MSYSEEDIKSLDWNEHIRLRPGMYIGKLGNGKAPDDGIYVLIKEIIDNAVDEFVMGAGSKIDVRLNNKEVVIRDYGRGIPLGKLIDCVSKINTGGKYDSKAFQKSVGLNGVGTKAVNALSSSFNVQSIREGKTKYAVFEKGILTEASKEKSTTEKNGTIVRFIPDESVFSDYFFIEEHIKQMLWNYAYLNNGLTLYYNGLKIKSEKGLYDLLVKNIDSDSIRYPVIHLKGEDIELAFTHCNHYGEEYFTFVNGQHTTQGGTHQAAIKESLTKTVKDFYKKDFDSSDVRASISVAFSIRVQEPVFESQTKTKLGSNLMFKDGPSIRSYVSDFVKTELDNYLHKHPEIAKALLERILQSKKERTDFAGIKKLANERAKKASLYNKKLRDCKIHFNSNHEGRYESTLFITEGDSASGSITKSRNVQTQAVFSLKGKPLNCFGLSKKVVHENEEFNLIYHALDIEEDLDKLRYNKIVIATDADVDGMHIRLLLMTFFLEFFPELVRAGHVYILQTPLFRVRNKKESIYCYDEKEKQKALQKLGAQAEVTRFKGLGEISPQEFSMFIGKDMRLDPVLLDNETKIQNLLSYYMGKNTPDRQSFIVENLKLEKDVVEEEGAELNPHFQLNEEVEHA